jgi:ABC-2 type transport system ATP-binding protein
LRFAGVRDLTAAAQAVAGSSADEESLTLTVAGDGGTKSLRALLDRLAEHDIEAEELSVHTPDLDDVFLALTGHKTEDTSDQSESTSTEGIAK